MKKYIQIAAALMSLLLILSCVLVSCKKDKGNGDKPDSEVSESETLLDTETDTEDETESETEVDTEDDTESDTEVDTEDDTEDETEDDTEDDTESEEETNEMFISDKGTVNFNIIFPDGLSEDIALAVTNLHSSLTKRSGGGLVMTGIASLDQYNTDSYEILVGDTQYPESKQVMDELGYGEWTVRFVGNKLVVAGFSRSGLNSAISELVKTIKNKAEKDGTIIFEADMNVTKTEHAILNELPRFDVAAYPRTADEGNSTGLAVVKIAKTDEYSAYLSKLVKAGYKLYTSNEINGNKFSTYDNGEYVVHAGYYAYESSIRATIEKKTNLVGLQSENIYTENSKVVTSLAQIGLGESVKEGMSYCYQLSDGSFLVIDGGFSDDSEQLYEYMRAKAPGEKIIIAAWFLSHNDTDHRSAFISFNAKYKSDVVIERFVHNLPAALIYEESGGNGDNTALGIANELEGCKIIKAHTGQVLYIRNAKIEMLYTLDSYLPRILDIFNNSSLVFTVDVEGERALFMGDGGDEVAQILYSMYGDYLKSDILQLAHHGLRNGHGTNMPHTIKLYKLVRPEVVLWPSSNKHYLDKSINESQQVALHKWNIEGLKSARECYMAGDGITVLELPYSLYSAYKFVAGENREPVHKDTASTSESLQYDDIGSDIRVSWNK